MALPGTLPAPLPIDARHPAAPDVAAYSGSIDQRLAMLAQQVSRKATLNGVPAFTAIMLTDPNGVVWRVSIDTNGNLDTAQVPRT